jgi:hypothetical protein
VAIASFLVDKSAWARLHHAAVSTRLLPLIDAGLVATCAVIELELRYSARNHDELESISRQRGAGYEYLAMPDEVWDRALEVQHQLSARGQLRAVGIPDLLIAATAERHGVHLLHYDGDYDLIAAVTGQDTDWVAPAGSVP